MQVVNIPSKSEYQGQRSSHKVKSYFTALYSDRNTGEGDEQILHFDHNSKNGEFRCLLDAQVDLLFV